MTACKSKPCISKIIISLYTATVAVYCFAILLKFFIRYAEIIKRIHIIRFILQSFKVAFSSFLDTSCNGKDVCPVIPGRTEIIRNSQSHVVRVKCLVIALHFAQHKTIVVPRINIVWVLIKSFAVAGGACIKISKNILAVGKFIPCISKIRINFQGTLKIRFSLSEAFKPLQNYPMIVMVLLFNRGVYNYLTQLIKCLIKTAGIKVCQRKIQFHFAV